ncbi:MAG TPA: diguanylate cyclase [Myxococcales bacterium]|jgi:diguanylate cyclase (GGDEF)-like protein|nr:diguanylate cyclase [Myxococcales bacterium]
MRLPAKLALLLAGATCFPLALATAFTLPRGRQALRNQLDQIYAQDARALAAEVHRTLVDKLDALTLAASTLRLGELDPEAREQALLLIYKETRGADVVGLFDAAADAVGKTIQFSRLEGELAREHEPVDDVGLTAYAGKVPLRAALQAGLAIGPVYVLPDAEGLPVPRLVLAVKVGGERNARWVLAVEISLRRLAESFERFRPGESGAAFLVDGEGKVILHSVRKLMFQQASLKDHPLVRGEQSDAWVGANATVPLLGWKAVVQEPAEEALRPLRHLQQDALLWLGVGLLAAVVLGFTSVRSVTAPVRKLREAVVAVASGALDTPVEIKRSDELGELADAFNTMTRGLREREGLKLTLALSESLKLDDVLGRLLDGLRDAVPFEEGAVLIKTRDGLDVIVTRGSRGKRESERIVPISSHVERALRTLLPALNEGRQMMALPLIQHGVAIGVVCLESRNAYGESDVRLALSLTQPAAMAVENARLFDEVNRLATLDGLTGIYNRRHFMDQALRAYETARRFGQPLTALMLDVDHFKTVNDRYGHHVGDQVLRVLAERCRGALRSVDVLGRFGGEEFAILLPGTTQQSAANILAERIRRRVADDPVPTDAGPVKVTVSVGVAAIDEQTRHPDDLLKRADAALYEAKQAGRNRVVEDAVA